MAPANILQPASKPGAQAVATPVALNATIKWHDTLQTGDTGRIRAQLNDGSILSIGTKSQLVVQKHDEKRQQSELELSYGTVRSQVVHLAAPNSSFEVRTNTAVCGVLGTDVAMDGNSPTQTIIIVITGVVAVRNRNPNVTGTTTLTAGQFTVVRDGQAPTAPQQASPGQISNAVTETTGNVAPQPNVALSTLDVPYGGAFTLNASASSGGIGNIVNYTFLIPSRNFSQSGTSPVLNVDSSDWPAGTYTGTLTVTVQTDPSDPTKTSSATAPFQFTIQNPPSPADTIAGLANAYTALQPSNFTQWFDPAYPGESALASQLEQAIPAIQALQVTYPAPQISITGKTATCTTNFTFRITPKPVPPATTSAPITYTTGSVTLPMTLKADGSRWLINSVIGALGSSGMLSVPGSTTIAGGNTVNGSDGVAGLLVPGVTVAPGNAVTVFTGAASSGTVQVTPQNGFTGSLTLTFGPNLPIGVTAAPTNPVLVGANPVSIPYTLNIGSSAATGQVSVAFTITGTGVSQPGSITLNIQKLAITVPASPVVLYAGNSTTVPITVSAPVTLTALSSDPAVTATVTPVSNGSSTLTLTSTNSTTGAMSVTLGAKEAAGSATVQVNRQAPVINVTGPPTPVNTAPQQPGTATVNVPFNTNVTPPFTGQATVTAPTIPGLTFTPLSQVLNASGTASFQVSTNAIMAATVNTTFTITAGKYSITVPTTINLFPAYDFSIDNAALTLAPGASGSVTVPVTQVPGTGTGPLPVGFNVINVPAGITVAPLSSSLTGSGNLTFTVGTSASTGPGAYPFNVAGAGATASHVSTVVVTVQAQPVLIVTANNKSKTYGSANPALDVTYGGFTGGDTASSLTGTLACTTTGTTSSPVANYPITCAGQTSSKYTIQYVAGTLSVTPAPLTILANNKSRTVGTPNPALDATYTGFVLTDTSASLTGTLSCSTPAGITSPAGTYPITCSGQSSTNYAITYTSGTLTVTGLAPLTVTANNKSRGFGAPNPPLDVTYSGFLGPDGPTSLGGTLNCSTTATVSSPVNTYPITCSGQTSSAYAITYVPGTLTITPLSTATTVASNANPAAAGTNVTFTATVSPAAATGNVTFFDGASSLGTAGLNGGTASFSITTLSVGTHSITAVYNGDTNDNTSSSPAISQVINGTPSTTAVASSQNPSTAGQSVTFTATVTPNTATGTVTFLDGATAIGTGTLSGGSATFTTTSLSGGTHSITAAYGGSATVGASTSTAIAQVVNAAQSATTVASSTNPSTFGANVTFTATVSPVSATGTVTFKDGTATLGAGTLSSGTATFTTGSLTVGTHSITAVYGGDANNVTSTSTAISQVVNKAASSTVVTSSLNPSAFGQSVTFTATVGGSATGSVSFHDGTNLLGTGTLNGGTATFTTSALTGGNHSIDAAYGGDANYNASSSQMLTQTVGQPPSSTALTSSVNPSSIGQAVTFTAIVTPNTATGSVTFMDGATTIGTATLTNAQASLTTSTLTAGAHSITAVYGGDTSVAANTSNVLMQLVSAASSRTSVATSGTPSMYGQPVTFTATVTPNVATGSVAFLDGSTTLGSGPLNNGVATFTTSSLSAATHSITATYSGDANYGSSTSTAVSQSITPAPLTITANDQMSTTGSPLPALTATYTGLVNGDTAGSLTGTLTCTTTATPNSSPGTYPITCSGQSSLSYTITYVAGTLTMTAGAGGTLSPGSLNNVGAGSLVQVPLTLALANGVSIDSLSLGVSITPNGSAPPINSGALTFTPDASFPAPNFKDTGGGSNVIAVLWSSLSPPITGTLTVGTVGVMIPAAAGNSDYYTVHITGSGATSNNSHVTITPGPDGKLTVGNSGKIAPGQVGAQSITIRGRIGHTPQTPRDGDTVKFHVRVANHGAADANNITVALQSASGMVVSQRVNIAAGHSTNVELDWKAQGAKGRQLGSGLSVAVDPEHRFNTADTSDTLVAVDTILSRQAAALSVPQLMSGGQSRLSLDVRNEKCAGIRLSTGAQSGCGGSADLEFNPAISPRGTLDVRTEAPGGIRDLGPMTLSSSAQLPASTDGGASQTLMQQTLMQQAMLQQGHVYAVRTGDKTAYVRVARIRSSVDPRLTAPNGTARGTGAGIGPTAGRGGNGSDIIQARREQEQFDRILDNARITIELEWLVR